MSDNNVSLELTASDKATPKLKNLGKSTNELKGKMAGLQTRLKKVDNSFINLGKDANRTGNQMKSLSKISSTLQFGTAIYLISQLADNLANLTNSAMDMIEIENLFAVSMGKSTEETLKWIDAVHQATGLDITNIKSAVGTYALLAKSMGMTADQAQLLSTQTYQLALDLSSLTNVPINQVLGDLRSGLVGQSETVYKYGMDITEASLKTEALRAGITKSVRDMTQGEKMLLRYNAMIRQSQLAHGDFAKTIQSPANQMKIFQERLTTASRSIGSIFIPMLSAILPYANAVLVIITRLADRVAKFFGYKPPKAQTQAKALTTIAKSADSATKSVKELQRQVFGFDELNILADKTKDTTSDTNTLQSPVSQIDIDKMQKYDAMLTSITDKSRELADKIMKPLVALFNNFNELMTPLKTSLEKLYDEGFKKFMVFQWTNLKSFYDYFLVPVGKYVLGKDGIPALVDLLNKLLNNIDWVKLQKSFSSFYSSASDLAKISFSYLVAFVKDFLEPIGEYVVNKTLNDWLAVFSEVLDSISSVLTDVKPALESFMKNILVPLGKFTLDVATEALKGFTSQLKDLAKWFDENPEIMEGLSNFFESVGKQLSIALPIVAKFLGALLKNLLPIITGFGAFTGILKILASFFSALGDLSKGDVEGAFKSLGVGMLEFLKIVAQVPIGVKNTVSDIASIATDIGNSIFDKIQKTVTTDKMVKFGADIVTKINSGFANVPNAIKNKFSSGFTLATNIFSKKSFTDLGKSIIKYIVSEFAGISSVIKHPFSSAWTSIKSIFTGKKSGLVAFFTEKITEVKAMFSGLGKVVGTAFSVPFKSSINTVLTGLESTINSVFHSINKAIKLINKLPGIEISLISDVKIQKLARGGVVDSGQIYQAGEAGKEAIVPLENNTQWIDKVASRLSTSRSGVGLTKMEVKQAFKEALNETSSGDVVLVAKDIELARATNRGNDLLNRRFTPSLT